jgi:hypothetical protein
MNTEAPITKEQVEDMLNISWFDPSDKNDVIDVQILLHNIAPVVHVTILQEIFYKFIEGDYHA